MPSALAVPRPAASHVCPVLPNLGSGIDPNPFQHRSGILQTDPNAFETRDHRNHTNRKAKNMMVGRALRLTGSSCLISALLMSAPLHVILILSFLVGISTSLDFILRWRLGASALDKVRHGDVVRLVESVVEPRRDENGHTRRR
ncbi:hypothetical protein ACFWN2_11795 [Lentzea sp. NPDC058436]|uniref:hypothetical protein n=1 Tax=Lentzea sp. NPDC058436 TaxID=3346499 RepID=UPI003653A2C0